MTLHLRQRGETLENKGEANVVEIFINIHLRRLKKGDEESSRNMIIKTTGKLKLWQTFCCQEEVVGQLE